MLSRSWLPELCASCFALHMRFPRFTILCRCWRGVRLITCVISSSSRKCFTLHSGSYRMKRALAIAMLLLLTIAAWAPARAAELQYNGRNISRHVEPVLPDIARKMHLEGTVRLQVLVAAAGKVTAVKALGGHPILITAATNAVKEWLFEPDSQETTVVVSFTFK